MIRRLPHRVLEPLRWPVWLLVVVVLASPRTAQPAADAGARAGLASALSDLLGRVKNSSPEALLHLRLWTTRLHAADDPFQKDPSAVRETPSEASGPLGSKTMLRLPVPWAVAGDAIPPVLTGSLCRVPLAVCTSIACRCVQLHGFRGPPLASLAA
jgi:hypothetical protein